MDLYAVERVFLIKLSPDTFSSRIQVIFTTNSLYDQNKLFNIITIDISFFNHGAGLEDIL